MSRRGCTLATPPRWWGLVMVLLALVLSEIVPLNAVAQGAPLSVAVTNLNLASISGVEDRLALTFNGLLPIYSVTANDQSTVSIAIAGAVRAPSAVAAPSPGGLLRAVDFSQDGQVLTISLTGVGPLHIETTPLSAKAVVVRITRSASPKLPVAEAPQALGAHRLPLLAEDGFVVVPLKYADVSEVVGLLTTDRSVKPNDSFIPQEPAFGSVGSNNGYGATGTNLNPGQQTPPNDQSVGQSIDDAIGVDRRLNAIILHGPPDLVARLRAKIDLIDQPVESVILETVFVELTGSAARNVGLDFNNAAGQIATAVYQTGPFITAANGSGKGVSLQAAISAQVQQGQGRILSKPRISAQSGSTAKIITGDALPILTSITLSGVNGVSQQVQYVNVGVTLQIAPRVTEDGFVTSHIFCVVSSVTGASQGYPTISQREASTSATVRDGESFIIGGLSQESKLSTDSKIPLLGDVPGLGLIGRSATGSSSKTDLYIVVTPHIVRVGHPLPKVATEAPGLNGALAPW